MFKTQISAWEIQGTWPLLRPGQAWWSCVLTMTIPFPCACAYVSMAIEGDGQVHRFEFLFAASLCRRWDKRQEDVEVSLAQFATGFFPLNHQAELR